MSKKTIVLLFITFGLITVSTYAFYRFMIPNDFYTEEELLEEITHGTLDEEILDIVQLDEKTYFVPFLSTENSYSSSIWVWRFGKWQSVGTSTASDPQIVTNNGNSYIYWNVHPRDEIHEWDFYLTSERSYTVANANSENPLEVYMPRIQVKHTIEVENESFGFVELPEKWEGIIRSFDLNPSDSEFLPTSHYYQFEWQAYNGIREAINLDYTFRNGGGGSYSGEYITHMQQLNHDKLE
ncbi:hypothetical protein [Halalkalibacter sp. APA_J-10(15)]|uniref:hypothetical protein n=1 Tax=unclassified Halalkalibacter TaxID=2893063 RepID=UPI001FF443CD|nr:hypothetical protein [Halalkalibacter sp. APA_J-10(15)]MCK0473724.1 hypothetical protein [Halalkalibacter sp. APA_J-10(15)]